MAIVSLVIMKSPYNNNSEIHKYYSLSSEAEMALYIQWLWAQGMQIGTQDS